MLYYLLTFSMYEIESYEVNSPYAKSSILIGTQGSDFKDKITSEIVTYYSPKDVYLKVTDISSLHEYAVQDFDAIIVMHTWEYGSAPDKVKKFLHKNSQFKDKMVVLSTSGDGSNKIKDVDAITGESILENSDEMANKIIEQVNLILNK